MAFIRLNPQLPSVLDRFFESDLLDWKNRNYSLTNTTLPSVNIKETADDFQVEVAAPGFEKNDFKIEVHNDVITISSERRNEKEEKDGEEYTKREFSYQAFTRSFTLPPLVNESKINASYEKGILLVSIPKKEEAKPKEALVIDVK